MTIKTVLDEIRRARKLTVYEGLPRGGRPLRPGEKTIAQWKQTSKTKKLRGFDFFAAPISFHASQAQALQRLCQNSALYRPYRGDKKCDGFHPDWYVQLDRIEALLCFGCDEVHFHRGAESVMADLADATTLKQLLQRHHKNLTRS